MTKSVITDAYYSNGRYYIYVRRAGLRHIFDVLCVLDFDSLPTRKEVIERTEKAFHNENVNALMTKTLKLVLQ